MAGLIAGYDWSASGLGPVENWPASLRTITAYLLHCQVPLVLLWGEDGIMIYNDAYSEFAAGAHPALLGSKVREGWPEVADFNDNVMRVGLSGGTLAYKNHMLTLHRNGRPEPVWMNLDYSPVYDETGKPAGVLAIVVETTDAVRADAALRDLNETLEDRTEERLRELSRSQTQFRLLVQGVTDYAIYMLDPEGQVSSWNAGAERIKGYAPEEIIGEHFSRFYPDEDRARGEPVRALETARREGRFAAEGWRVRKDGSRFRASVVIDAIQDDDGQLIGFAKITRDVTEREQTQRELEMAREALFQSQKMDAIGQLTGGVAHDFNNLLMAILSSFALLRKRVPHDPQIMRLIDNGVQGAERGAVLTQRMLAFARRQDLKTAPLDLAALVTGMTDLLQRTIGPAWTIVTEFPANLSMVVADANQLEMALLNLVVNARDAMPDGGQIRIEARDRPGQRGDADLSPGDYVELSVIDHGIGMDAATLERASEPFFTTKGVGKGTGLGLSMIHGYARQLGGTLALESDVGVGTRAHLWLPAGGAAAATGAEPASDAAAPAIAARTVLTVDDDGLVLMNTAALLEDLGHIVIEATSASEALELFRQRPDIGLLITDQAMPGMTGSQLIEAVRAERPELPIILASGYGETPADGVTAVVRLGKPFSQPDLQHALAAALG